jgi:hypothetical protein
MLAALASRGGRDPLATFSRFLSGRSLFLAGRVPARDRTQALSPLCGIYFYSIYFYSIYGNSPYPTTRFVVAT